MYVYCTNLKSSLKFSAGLVHGFASLHELNDEDGEVLVRSRANGDGHRSHARRRGQVDLKEEEEGK